ncbi:MAG: nucleotidyltransferase family protein [Pyrinomonadaceae bacterium]
MCWSTVVSESSIGVIVLAAGASRRMGESKQLLRYEGETLLRRATRAALDSQCRPVIVVLGARADALRAALEDENAGTEAHILINRNWAEGMSSSIRSGLAALEALTEERARAVVLTLCDQPFVTGHVINRLRETYETTCAPLVAAEYESHNETTRGVPALFSRTLFPELRCLRGHEGAKPIIERHVAEAAIVAVPEAAFDVDTPHDYRVLLSFKVVDDADTKS